KTSSREFEDVSQEVVKYVNGHPLALKVLGRFLYDKTVGQWASEVDKLKVYPNEQIQRVLRLCYDGLDLHQKNILLDIACLFVGENRDFVASVLDGCDYFAVTNMKVLVDKSLVTISSDMSLQMHGLIQAMARGIVREESIMPGKQIRLWNLSEVYDLLSGKKVAITKAEAVEVLVLLLEKSSEKVHIDATGFEHFKKLRILKIYQFDKFLQEFELKNYNVKYSGSLYFLSNELRYSNLEQVPESIGGLSCLRELGLEGNNFTSLPGSLSQLSHLEKLRLNGCKKLEVLPELPPSVWITDASDCTSLREVLGSSKDPFTNRCSHFSNCPKLFKNVTIDSEGSISKTQCLDSSITSQGFIHQLSAFLGYLGFQTNTCEFFLQDSAYSSLDIVYPGNSIPEWFTNRSTENPLKVELPSDWSYDKFRGYGTCVVFKCKKPFNKFEGYSVKNFDGASLFTVNNFSHVEEFLEKEVIGIHDSYIIWFSYTRAKTGAWKKAKNFVTFSFEENEDIEVKEVGVRLICDEDLKQQADLSMLQGLPTPSQHGWDDRLLL
ncbi:NB-ARC domains-containing protein, partial [Tanacetum coccineum]